MIRLGNFPTLHLIAYCVTGVRGNGYNRRSRYFSTQGVSPTIAFDGGRGRGGLCKDEGFSNWSRKFSLNLSPKLVLPFGQVHKPKYPLGNWTQSMGNGHTTNPRIITYINFIIFPRCCHFLEYFVHKGCSRAQHALLVASPSPRHVLNPLLDLIDILRPLRYLGDHPKIPLEILILHQDFPAKAAPCP